MTSFRNIVLLFWAISVPISSYASLRVWTSGNRIWATVGEGLAGDQCCRYATLDEQSTFGSCSVSCPATSADTNFFDCNWVGDHVVKGCWSDDSTNGYICEQQTVTVTEPPPTGGCTALEFLPNDRKVLTHKYGQSDTYPWGQTADGQIELILRSHTVSPGTPIYIRVDDPPTDLNTAPYGVHVQNDNQDRDAGTIAGEKAAQVIVPANGRLSVILSTTDHASGDNYDVRASADPSFMIAGASCPVADCATTRPITVWKRVYLERNAMFRKGSFLTAAPVPERCSGDKPGTTECTAVPVETVSQFAGVSTVRIVHAPRLDGTGPRAFYQDDRKLLKIDVKKGATAGTLHLDRPALSGVYGLDPSVLNVNYLNDAVGAVTDVTRHTNSDFFLMNEQYLGLYNSTFIEFADAPQCVSINITSDAHPITEIPYIAQMSDLQRSRIPNKWFQNSTAVGQQRFATSNYKHVLGGSRLSETPAKDGSFNVTLGMNDDAISASGLELKYLWTFGARIEEAVSQRLGGQADALYDADVSDRPTRAWKINGENVVHEFVHMFLGAGHCSEQMAVLPPGLTAPRWCTMNDKNWGDPAVSNSSELFDNIVGLHWLNDVDSEYMKIRRQPDPVPQN